MVSFGSIWKRIEAHQGEKFHQIRGQEFTYKVVSGAVIPSTTNRQLPRSHFAEAANLLPLRNTVPVQHLQGPSYLYAILMDRRIRQTDW